MKSIKIEVEEQFGSMSNFSNVLTKLMNMGINVMPMLRHWKPDVTWKFANGDVVGNHPGVVWVVRCKDTGTCRLLHQKAKSSDKKVGYDKFNSVRVSNSNRDISDMDCNIKKHSSRKEEIGNRLAKFLSENA